MNQCISLIIVHMNYSLIIPISYPLNLQNLGHLYTFSLLSSKSFLVFLALFLSLPSSNFLFPYRFANIPSLHMPNHLKQLSFIFFPIFVIPNFFLICLFRIICQNVCTLIYQRILFLKLSSLTLRAHLNHINFH